MENFKERIAAAQAFVFDVDGVFTDGGIIPLPDGDFIRKYYAKDGYAVAYAVRMGYTIGVITGGRGALLRRRFAYYGVARLYDDCNDKLEKLQEFLSDFELDPARVIYMGDDVPDVECMRAVGLPVAPADAAAEVLEAAVYVSEYPGGRGCVRDIIEQVLRARGDWARDYRGMDVPSV